MKKKIGFNFLWMYSFWNENVKPSKPNLAELDFIAEEGFNFVRIPTDYRFFTDADVKPKGEAFELIDNYIEECIKRGLHANFNIHRAPGYCINSPEIEKFNLWRDEEAQNQFVSLWSYIADRYKSINSDKLSFDLVNEPANIPPTHPCTIDDYRRVMIMTIDAIRKISPDRDITIDGFNGGGTAIPELADLGVTHSGRGYEPFPLTHYHAEWAKGADKFEMPEYPGYVQPGVYKDINTLREYYSPWKAVEDMGVKIHIGEFGCYNKISNTIALRWLEDLITVLCEYGWGYAMWNFNGAFGIVEHGRPDTRYENYKGFNVDMRMLEIMKMGILS